MGLLGKLFGGGTKLELKLDASQIPEGGFLSGTTYLTGGKKLLTVTDLKVRLYYVQVTSVPGQSLPKIDLKLLIDNTLASNATLEPGSLLKHAFSFQVPKGTDPNGTYKVIAVADIPGVLDPKAEAALKVTAAVERGFFGFAKGAAAADAATLLKQFPGLESNDEEALTSALHDLQCEAYDASKNLIAAEPILARMMREGRPSVRAAALGAWGTVLNNRALPEHIKTLEAMAVDPATTGRLMREVVEVAAKFAEEGALPLVQRLAQHADPDIRESMATNLYLNADKKLKERKTLLLQLVQDASPNVRAAAVSGLVDFFGADKSMVEKVASILNADPSPTVKAKAVRAMSIAGHYSSTDSVFNALTPALSHPALEVREALASSISSLPDDPRLDKMVAQLLGDKEVSVRRAIAWQSCNLGEVPRLAPHFINAATTDSVLEVRTDALGGLANLMPLTDTLALYAERLQKDQAEATHWAVVNGLRNFSEQAPARQMLEMIAGSQTYSAPARVARECLESK